MADAYVRPWPSTSPFFAWVLVAVTLPSAKQQVARALVGGQLWSSVSSRCLHFQRGTFVWRRSSSRNYAIRREGNAERKRCGGKSQETDEMGSSCELSQMLPRVVIVSRRTVRKNKFVDFVGEYHLDLIVAYGAVPVIVPRVAGIHTLLQSFEPIHGVLLCEGEDVNPALYGASATDLLSPEEADEVRRLHSSDAAFDNEKDSIELRLARFCLERSIPFLGICRGSQVLNVACGGTLYQDIEKEVTAKCKPENATVHIDYGNYDGHRHPVRVVEGTPLNDWFRESLEEGRMEMLVNSYHHQGVRRMADRFVPMAFARDGLIEGFYDPNLYNPEEGKFLMGLQFHPERMRRPGTEEFDYPGCPAAYREFVKAVIAYQKKVNSAVHVADGQKLDKEMENNRKKLVRSFSLAKHIYVSRNAMTPAKERDLEVGAKFLESNAALSPQQQKRLNQMGATVRNATSYLERLKLNEERKTAARIMMEKMPAEQLTELLSFYLMMGNICSDVLDKKLKAT